MFKKRLIVGSAATLMAVASFALAMNSQSASTPNASSDCCQQCIDNGFTAPCDCCVDCDCVGRSLGLGENANE